MGFFAGIAWCLSGWLACKVSQKIDQKPCDWQEQLAAFAFGPLIFVAMIMEYLKQKYRNAHPSKIPGTRRKRDIFDVWEVFLGLKD